MLPSLLALQCVILSLFIATETITSSKNRDTIPGASRKYSSLSWESEQSISLSKF